MLIRNMPTISVIIPAYNAEQTIVETINSVLKQTFAYWELIVINDGSTDNTLKLLTEIKDSRIKVFSYPNGGLAAARNRGIALASGKYISFLDADDMWTSDKLELQLKALVQNPKAGVAYSWTMCMDNKTKLFHTGVTASFQGNVYPQLLVNNFIASGSNVLLTKEAVDSVGEFDGNVRSVEDWDYWLRLAPIWDFVVVPKPQIIYRLSSDSMSSKVDVMETNMLLASEKAFASAPTELQYLKNKSHSFIYKYVTKLHLTRIYNQNTVHKAAGKLWRSIYLYPKCLFDTSIWKLLVKLLLFFIFSSGYANRILLFISRARAVDNPM
jgi:glycosyltransferase involved in cell wall biosynthesis